MTTRRNFLKTSALMVAAASLAKPSTLWAGNGRRPFFINTKKSGSKKMLLTWEPFEAKMKHVFTIANFSRSTTPIVLTQIAYDGYVGYGEASMPPYLGETIHSVCDFLERVPAVLERHASPFEMEDILREVDAIATNNTAAKCAVDIALHDLVGKIMGQPWWKIWGWHNVNLPSTCVTVGLAYNADGKTIDKEEVRKKTRECLEYNLIKVKLGNTEENDHTMIETIREITDLPIVVDANQGWKSKSHALNMIEWLADHGVEMVEQPMPKYNLEDMDWLHQRSPLPLMADESCQRLVDIPKLKGCFDGINIKLMKCTGMREAREMISLAKALNMRLMMGCMTETSVAISAAAQFASQLEWADLDGNWLIANDCFKGMQVVNGRITLDEKPGIGVEPLNK